MLKKLVVGVLAVVFVLFAVFLCGMSTEIDSTPPQDDVAIAPECQLEVIDWNVGRASRGFAEVHGMVRNLSTDRLGNVTAVVNWYTADNTFIRSDDALIEYNPIMPGQSSPFRVISPYNPQMHTARIEFKELMGGKIRARRGY